MMYRDTVKKLAKEADIRFDDLARAVGMSGQARLSARLCESWNPGMRDSQRLLAELGYKIVFIPEGTRPEKRWLEPEFPEKPKGR